jgi:hypothetical protein
MSWTRLDDGWTDDPIINQLPFPDRWHYLAMIQFCSRTKTFDGTMRAIDANRCSDHPDVPGALKIMAALGLVTIDGGTVHLNRLDEHIPPPSVRNAAATSRVRKQRSRKHLTGDHSECLSSYCEQATPLVTPPVTRDAGTQNLDDEDADGLRPVEPWPGDEPGTGYEAPASSGFSSASEHVARNVTPPVTRDTGTGQDRTGQAKYYKQAIWNKIRPKRKRPKPRRR